MSLTLIQTLYYVGIGLALLHFVVAGGFILRLLTARRVIPTDAECPSALVILCLRGADPSLSRCLTGLLNQNYPRFEVLIVVDDPADDAWRAAHEIVAAAGATNVQIEALQQRPATCGLKCAALLQAWTHVDDRYAVVATLDSDVVPHSTWLRELIAPLADPRVGATCGNRWYRPSPVSTGAAVRLLWNAGAIVPMFWHGIAWGGSLALRSTVLRDTDYPDRVHRALCEDVMLRDVLRTAGLRLRFNPNLMLVNHEDCTLNGFFHWMRRQTLIMKLYHADSPAMLTHGLLSGAYSLVAVLALIVAAVQRNQFAIDGIGLGWAWFMASLAVPVPMMNAAMRRIVGRRGETLPPYSWIEWLKLAAALPLTQLVYSAAVFTLLWTRQIEWRGIFYRVDGPLRITRLNDGAYRAADEGASNRSL